MRHKIIWTLSNGTTIEKMGEDVQQVFVKLSRKDRTDITNGGTTVSCIPHPTQKEAEQLAKESAKAHLLKMLQPGTVVYTTLRHCSRSGMMRHISLSIPYEGEIVDITGYAAQFMGENRADDGGIKMSGCGMDMGFALVYDLSRRLFNGTVKSDAGYVLKHRWA